MKRESTCVVRLVLLGLAVLLWPSCLEKTVADKRTDGVAWAIKESIRLERNGSRTGANVRFTSKKSVNCEIALWSVDPTIEPSSANPRVQPCLATNATVFDEEVRELRTDTYYIAKISMWSGDEKASSGHFLVEEGTRPGGSVNGENGSNRDISGVLVARMDIPTRSAEIHGAANGSHKSITALRESIVRKVGCSLVNSRGVGALSKSSNTLPIKGLSMRGFVSGQAVQHPSQTDRLKIGFNTLQPGAAWEWAFNFGESDVSFFSREAARFRSIDIESATSMRFPEPTRPEVASTSLPLNSQQPLRFVWKADGVGPGARVVVRIGQPAAATLLECVFDAGTESGAIEPPQLAALVPGANPVYVDLEYPQIQVFPGTNRPVWVIVTHDWRSAQVDKL